MDEQKKQELSSLIIDGPPWEKRHEIGFFVAFFESIRFFLTRPSQTFSVMRRESGISDALLYTVSLQVFGFVWRFSLDQSFGQEQSLIPPELQDILNLPENFTQILILIFPLWLIMAQFINSAAFHFALKWRGRQSYNYQLIFRIFAYGAGSAAVLLLIPGIGGLLSMMLTFYLYYVGFKVIYGLSVGEFLSTGIAAFFIAIGLYLGLVITLTALEIIGLLLF